GVQGTGQGRAQTRQMRPSIAIVDVVRVAKDLLQKRVGPLNSKIDLDVCQVRPRRNADSKGDHVFVNGLLFFCDVRNEFTNPSLVKEGLMMAFGPLIGEKDPQARIQKSELSNARRKRFVVVLSEGKNRRIGHKGDL